MIPVFESMDEALASVVGDILHQGTVVSPRGIETKELVGASFILSNPRARRITIESRRWSEALAVGEFAWHSAASNRLDFIAYYAPRWASFSDDGKSIPGSCYGKKIFSATDLHPSQWEVVRETLTADQSSRRAVLILSDAGSVGGAPSRDLPCVVAVQFLIREGKLHSVTTMRSNDAIWGLCYDAYLVTMLQERLALELGVEVGWYQHCATSLHIYRDYYEMAEEIAVEPKQGSAEPMPRMTNPEALPAFLAVEESLRLDQPEATGVLRELPPYWRALARPLVDFRSSHLKRGAETSGVSQD
jgi:thymidylate synthase